VDHNGCVNALWRRLPAWIRDSVVTAARALVFAVPALAVTIILFVLFVVSMALKPIGVGFYAVPVVTSIVRQFTGAYRRFAREWAGVEIPTPYRPEPDVPLVSWRRYRWVVTDPATWRDLVWLLAQMTVGFALAVAPASLIVYGLEGVSGVALLLFGLLGNYGYGAIWMLDTFAVALLTIPQGAVLLAVGLLIARPALWLHAIASRALLGPTRSARETVLAQRVQHLSDSRAETVDAQAAELRRIERDLHDGAQARLVGLSMSIGLAEELLTRDPQAAQRLLAEAREASGLALTELRDLVRGIHPPVLAERGLDGAVRALALTVAIAVDVEVDLPGRPPAPVESAAYFTVAEALANVVKHSHATRAWIRLGHRAGTLAIVVGDDGAGGADPGRGSGLAGVRRRLAAFDATMSVVSPPGGPTVVTVELPCALSSPKTSPSSGTA
jgi:signal transduction histidine kinase